MTFTSCGYPDPSHPTIRASQLDGAALVRSHNGAVSARAWRAGNQRTVKNVSDNACNLVSVKTGAMQIPWFLPCDQRTRTSDRPYLRASFHAGRRWRRCIQSGLGTATLQYPECCGQTGFCTFSCDALRAFPTKHRKLTNASHAVQLWIQCVISERLQYLVSLPERARESLANYVGQPMRWPGWDKLTRPFHMARRLRGFENAIAMVRHRAVVGPRGRCGVRMASWC